MSENITIYRMAFADGLGVYSRPDFWMCPAQELLTAHPLPENDTALEEHPHYDFLQATEYKYCFISLAQYKRWFYNLDWVKDAKEVGVMLYEYAVHRDRVAIGTTQCIADLSDAQLIATHCPIVMWHKDNKNK